MTIFAAAAFPGREQAEMAKDVLEGEGCAVDLQGQADGSVVVAANPPVHDADKAALAERMRRLADEFGGDFLGTGELTGRPLRRHS